MAKKAQAIPKGYHTVTPSLFVAGAAKAIDFYKKALGAEELMRFAGPGREDHARRDQGRRLDRHARRRDARPGRQESRSRIGGTPVSFFVYGENVDAAWKRAVDAGAKADRAARRPVLGRSHRVRRGSVRPPVVARPARRGPDAGADPEERGSVLLSDGELASPASEANAAPPERVAPVAFRLVLSSARHLPGLGCYSSLLRKESSRAGAGSRG